MAQKERTIPFHFEKIEIPYIHHASLEATPLEWITIKFPNDDKYPDLAAAKFEALRCWACGQCEWTSMGTWALNCPSAAYPANFRQAAFRGQGKHYTVLGILQGFIEPSPEVVKIAYMCTLCGNCAVQCTMGIGSDPTVSAMALRRMLVKLDMGPLDVHKRFAKAVEESHNPYREPHEKRFYWLPEPVPELKKGAEIAYFAGCTGPYRVPDVCAATIRIMKAAGVDFTILGGEEWCCGSPLLMTGLWEEAKEILEHSIAKLEELGISRVVTACAGCFRQLKLGWKKLGLSEPKFEVLHATQLIAELINAGKIKLTKPVEAAVYTYHDPCHLGRHVGVFDEPREVLINIPGVKFVEMERIYHHSWCCGAGAGVMSGYPDFAQWAATERLKEGKAAGATIMTSTCPFCELNFLRAEAANKVGMKVADVVSLVAYSMGLPVPLYVEEKKPS